MRETILQLGNRVLVEHDTETNNTIIILSEKATNEMIEHLNEFFSDKEFWTRGASFFLHLLKGDTDA